MIGVDVPEIDLNIVVQYEQVDIVTLFAGES